MNLKIFSKSIKKIRLLEFNKIKNKKKKIFLINNFRINNSLKKNVKNELLKWQYQQINRDYLKSYKSNVDKLFKFHLNRINSKLLLSAPLSWNYKHKPGYSSKIKLTN